MPWVVNKLLLALYCGMTDEELAEIRSRTIDQRTQVDVLRTSLKSAVAVE